MKLRVVRPACTRVQAALDDALTTGELRLPPELLAHIDHCPHCAKAADSTQQLLHRVRSAAAGLPLTLLPGAVESVLSQTTPTPAASRRRLRPAWFLGQFASLAGMLLLLVCLLIGLVGLVMLLLGRGMQSAWQPLAQALCGSPYASLLLEREMHIALRYTIFPLVAIALTGVGLWGKKTWAEAIAWRLDLPARSGLQS